MNGPPLYDRAVSSPAGSPSVLSRNFSCRAVSLTIAAHVSRLFLPSVQPTAYAASFADSIIIAARISSRGQRVPAAKPILLVSMLAVPGQAVMIAVGASRSTAVSAVMIFAVLAGCIASWTFTPASTRPEPASTTIDAFGAGSEAVGAAVAGALESREAARSRAAPVSAARHRGRRMASQARRNTPSRTGRGPENGSGSGLPACHH